jgi:hypothetical protein
MALDPLNFMFAIITDETQARRAFEELRRRGLGDDEVFVLAGPDGASWIDSIGNRPAIIDPEEQKQQQAKLADSPPEPEPEAEPAANEGSAAEANRAEETTAAPAPGLITRFMRALGIEPQAPGGPVPNWSDPDRYKHAAREGHFVFAVRAPQPEDQDRISRILREHGGRFINYYGRLNTTTFYR